MCVCVFVGVGIIVLCYQYNVLCNTAMLLYMKKLFGFGGDGRFFFWSRAEKILAAG